MSRLFAIAVVLLLLGCQLGGKNTQNPVDQFLQKSSQAFQLTNSYAVVKNDFERGRIMRARARALSMKKDHSDYAITQQYLNDTIEPARRRIFVHYLRTAKKLEKNQQWSKAMWAYDQAKSITTKPDVMEQKRLQMEQKMRQLRFEKLVEQRRREDETVLSYATAYEAPLGVDAADPIYERMREQYNSYLDDRAHQAYQEARRYLRKGEPESAYVEAESYARMQPDAQQGHRLLAEVKQDMPSFISIPGISKNSAAKKKLGASSKRQTQPTSVSAGQVEAALKAGELVKAKRMAHIYRRNGGKGSEQLLRKVLKQVDVTAARYFSKGSDAFRKEQLDTAIKYWGQAATLSPEQSEYVESLRRARQLKERLSLLQEQKDSKAPVPEEE